MPLDFFAKGLKARKIRSVMDRISDGLDRWREPPQILAKSFSGVFTFGSGT
jgi:hypothetical protein